MAAIQYLAGDATVPQAKGPKIIAHVCNDRGGWGKGFVLAVSARWQQPEKAFRKWYRERSGNDFGLGAVQVVEVGRGLWVANMIGQHGTKTGSRELVADIEANAAFLRDMLGDFRPASFAFPYGEASPRTKALASGRYATCRGIYPGVNRGWTDLAQLKAAPLEARSWSAEAVEALVADTKANGGWLIFFSHDVSEAPSPYGCTPAMLEHALATLAGAGIAALPVKHALAAGTFREAA